ARPRAHVALRRRPAVLRGDRAGRSGKGRGRVGRAERHMRIAFSGAAGTGKSHLAKIVAEWLSLPMCPVGSRTVCKEMGFEHAYDVDKAGMRPEFQKRLCRAKREWEADTAAFVTDRSHLDNLAYTSLHSIDTVGVEFLQ